MASKRTLLAVVQSRLVSPQCPRLRSAGHLLFVRPSRLVGYRSNYSALHSLHSRSFSQTGLRLDHVPSKQYDFDSIAALTKNPHPNLILIDVREPPELSPPNAPDQGGTIPTALNIPLTTAPDAYFLSPEEFEERFGFEKPGLETELVFFCRSGVRSKAAAQLAKRAGYQKVGEYGGSWLDWVEKGGKRGDVR
jgi:3-mercaptopyruvate sulfurtransferase SseA